MENVNTIQEMIMPFLPFIILLVLWEGVWKLLAMWRAAQNKQTGWFICLAIFNTMGILPIIYLLLVKKQKHQLNSHMPLSNYQRMIQLAEDVFAVKNDPDQLDVNEEVIKHLQKIHPSTVSEYDDGNGPVAWILLIPTTLDLMNRFLKKEISEKELFELTPPDTTYEAVYLCSAMVLQEYRRKGIAKKLTLNALENIRKDHPLKALFVWAFSKEGNAGAEALARLTSLPLYKRV